MDYEKKYNDALNLAKSYYGNGCNEFLDTIFPELSESEDERIRKHLVEVVELYWGKTNDPDKAQDLAYLEKQKEPENTSASVMAPSCWEVEQKEQKPDTRDADYLQLLGFIYDLLNEIEWKDNWAMSKEECLELLKSLRPSWKPSEEQMNALRNAVNKLAKTDVADSVRLSIMYDNLKKLM